MKTFFSDRFFLFFSLAANIVLSVYVFCSLNEAQINVYFNSDTLYLPSIYRDLFIDRSGFSGWHLNAAPNFFPDMFFYFILSVIVPDFILASFLYSLLQYIAILLLFYHIYRLLQPGASFLPLSLAFFTMLLFPLTTLLYPNDFIYTFYLYSFGYHMGSFLMALLSLLIFLSYLRTPSKGHLALLFVVVLAATVSDRLYLVQFPIPLLSGLLLWRNRAFMKIYLKPLVVTAIASGAGLLLFALVRNTTGLHIISTYSKMFNFSEIVNSFKIFIDQHAGYIASFDTRGIVNLISLCVITVFLFRSIRFLYRHFLQGGVPPESLSVMFFELFFPAFVLVVLFTPVINGGYQGSAMLRYNVYALYFSVFALGHLFFRVGSRSGIPEVLRGFGLVLSLLVIFLMVWFPVKSDLIKGFRNFRGYYPEVVACTDRFAAETGVRYGVAEYWNAKRISMFSREGVRAYTVFHDLAIWYHVMNENWYYTGGKGVHGDPDFRFVVMQGMDRVAVDSLLGQPSQIFECSKPATEVFLFPSFRFNRHTRKPHYPD